MRLTSVLAATALLVSVACGGSNPSSPSDGSGTGGAGTFNVRITDSPYGSAKAVLVTFSEVATHRNGDWTRLPFPGGSTRTCDLKKLQNAAQDLLGGGAIEPGTYTMIRLVVQSAKIYFDNSAQSSTPCAPSIGEPAGASSPLTIPSGEVRLNGSFGLTSSAATTVLVDFDGESSIIQNGSSYTMQPVIRIVSIQ
ncbi:MAG TPA: DUF4382 domain-containing protein [Vicinamibacterales bacterium]|jgi:hypothetical protein|nr:DUF4382 domain-containing protein [Vicinamibacterales bacterium]